MTESRSIPDVPAEVRQGRLVRVCPVCGEQIVERTDDEGMVSNRFIEHHETEHPEEPEPEPEPEKQRIYVLGVQPTAGRDPEAVSDLNRALFEHVRRHDLGVEWQLVDRLEDLPEGASCVQAAQVLAASWTEKSDPPHAKQIQWFKRHGKNLLFVPTEEQYAAYDEASRRIMDARFVLLNRRRDELPSFIVGHDVKSKGSEAVLEAHERFRAKTKPLEDAITKDLDSARDTAANEFHTGQIEWLTTIDKAIAAAGISEEEIRAQREWLEARAAEIQTHEAPESTPTYG